MNKPNTKNTNVSTIHTQNSFQYFYKFIAKLSTYKFIIKIKPFFLRRLWPIFALWSGVLSVYWIATKTLDVLLNKGGDAIRKGFSVIALSDGTIVFTLFFGAILAVAFFTVLFMNLTTDQSENNILSDFNCRIIDEISSASTHVSFAILASFFIPVGTATDVVYPTAKMISTFAVYLLIGYWFFYLAPETRTNSSKSAPV